MSVISTNAARVAPRVASDSVPAEAMNPGTIDASGEKDVAFRAAFVDYYERVLGVLLRLTGNRSDAEDLASEVFLRLSRQSPEWLLRNNVSGWLYRTATHAGIDFLRSRRRRAKQEQAVGRQLPVASDDSRTGPLVDALREDEARRVRLVLSGMKPERAQILLMRAGGAPYGEIAEALQVSIGSVGTLLNRAEVEFRKRYAWVNARKETR